MSLSELRARFRPLDIWPRFRWVSSRGVIFRVLNGAVNQVMTYCLILDRQSTLPRRQCVWVSQAHAARAARALCPRHQSHTARASISKTRRAHNRADERRHVPANLATCWKTRIHFHPDP
jgi:hypothetical protein